MKDTEGWEIHVGAYVRVEPRAFVSSALGYVTVAKYWGYVEKLDEDTGRLSVRERKRGLMRTAKPEFCLVVPPPRGHRGHLNWEFTKRRRR